jgi:hypothetical protein
LAALYTPGVVTGGQPGPTISRLLVDLAHDAALLERFKADPESVMDEYGLTEGQKEIVRSGNLALIRAAIDYEYRAGIAPGVLPDFAPEEEGTRAMVVTWRVPRPTW